MRTGSSAGQGLWVWGGVRLDECWQESGAHSDAESSYAFEVAKMGHGPDSKHHHPKERVDLKL
ncbi:MAG: hypothetical protein PVJ76_21210, partial [Gemmatimonadota bacterium]